FGGEFFRVEELDQRQSIRLLLSSQTLPDAQNVDPAQHRRSGIRESCRDHIHVVFADNLQGIRSVEFEGDLTDAGLIVRDSVQKMVDDKIHSLRVTNERPSFSFGELAGVELPRYVMLVAVTDSSRAQAIEPIERLQYCFVETRRVGMLQRF